MPATQTAHASLAAHTFTISRYQGYGLPSREVKVTLGEMLGADHVAWICEQPYPAGTAGSRARGMWDANELEVLALRAGLAHEIDEQMREDLRTFAACLTEGPTNTRKIKEK